MYPSRLESAVVLALPSLIAAAFVLTVFADTGAVLYALPRALVGVLLIALLAQAVATLLTRSLKLGSGLAAGLFVIAIDLRLGLLVLGIIVAAEYLARIGRPIRPLGALGFIGVALLTLSAGRTVASEAFAISDLIDQPNGDGIALGSDPDIYLMLLDGYPRSDTLAEWGYDNGWFDAELAARGFDVASQSTTSYTYTGLTLASMFNMAHLPDIPELSPAPTTHVGQTRALIEVINHNPVLEILERRGYWTVSNGLTEVRGSLRAVDEYIDGGEVRLWERQVMQRTALWPWLCESVVIPQHRALVNATFEQIEGTAARDLDAPVFMFAHVMSPHTPIVFNRGGEPASVATSGGCGDQFHIDAEGVGLDHASFERHMADQIHYLNERMLQTIDRVIERSPDAVIVVFSDHGARHSTRTTDEWFRSYLAARTPGAPDLMPGNARPIDIFPRLLAAYFEISTPRPDERRYESPRGTYLPLTYEPWLAMGDQP